jgi:D-alanyl-D-alanine dipeptidase
MPRLTLPQEACAKLSQHAKAAALTGKGGQNALTGAWLASTCIFGWTGMKCALRAIYILAVGLVLASHTMAAELETLPQGFVYLRDLAPSIVQDMRYATANNFTGKPVPGYDAPECVLQRNAAEALKRAQEKAESLRLSLKVYDCYRPVRAVRAFLAWAAAPEDGRTKRYYPRLNRSQLVPEYIASQSQHSTGLAVDLTLVPVSAAPDEAQDTQDCTAPAPERGGGGSSGMGTAFDCFDTKANTASPQVAPAQRKTRELLLSIVEGAGFKNYAAEWWHFSYPGGGAQRYDFPIEPRPAH